MDSFRRLKHNSVGGIVALIASAIFLELFQLLNGHLIWEVRQYSVRNCFIFLFTLLISCKTSSSALKDSYDTWLLNTFKRRACLYHCVAMFRLYSAFKIAIGYYWGIHRLALRIIACLFMWRLHRDINDIFICGNGSHNPFWYFFLLTRLNDTACAYIFWPWW